MCSFNTLKKYSLKRQFIIIFGGTSLIALLSIGICAIVSLFVISTNIHNKISSSLSNQAMINVEVIVKDSIALYDKKLDKSAKNFLNPISYLMGEAFRVDQPYAEQQFYYEWVDSMKKPVVFEQRYNSYISYDQSAISVAGYTPYTINTFSSDLNQTIYNTEAAAPTMKLLYNQNPEFISGYCAFKKHSLFREYPAASNGNYTQLIVYNATHDDWYQMGYLNQHKTLYTPIYYDPWVKQVMITIVRSIHNPDNGEFVGTAGGDMLTGSMRESISKIKYLKNGRTFMFETETGNIIADSLWTSNMQISRLNTYRNIIGMRISESNWQTITSTLNSQTVTIVELDDYFVGSKFLNTGENQYFISICVNKNDLLEQTNPILNSINKVKQDTYVTAICIFFGVVSLIVILVIYQAYSTVKPISDTNEILCKITSNLGNSNLAEGINIDIKDRLSEPTEVANIRSTVRTMVTDFKTKYENNKNNHNLGLVSNSHFKAEASRSHRTPMQEMTTVNFHMPTYNQNYIAPPPYSPSAPEQ
jgi:hypothetical protein